MRARRIGYLLLVVTFGVVLAVASPAFGQFEPIKRNPLTEAANKECEAIRTASIDDLNKEEEWLSSLVRDAEARTKQGAADYIQMAYGSRPPGKTVTKEQLAIKMTEVTDGIMELELLELFGEVVRECINNQRRVLQTQRRLSGEYLAHCTGPRHSFPPAKGRLDLELFSDNTIKVTLSENEDVTQIFGKMYRTGDFSASSKEGQAVMVQVDGKFQTFDPLTGSGQVYSSREFEGYGRVECRGRWVGK